MLESEILYRISDIEDAITRIDLDIFIRFAYIEDVAATMAGFHLDRGYNSVANPITQENWDYAYAENEKLLDEVDALDAERNDLLSASIDLQSDLSAIYDKVSGNSASRALEKNYLGKVESLSIEQAQDEFNSYNEDFSENEINDVYMDLWGDNQDMSPQNDDAAEFDVQLPPAEDQEINFLEAGIGILEDNIASILTLCDDGAAHTMSNSYMSIYENLSIQLAGYQDALDDFHEAQDSMDYLVCLRCSTEVTELDSHDHCEVCADELLAVEYE